jgi:adenylate cyclase
VGPSDASPDLAGRAAGGRKLIAVVYADMVGYSRLIGLDDAGTLRRLRTLRRALIDPAIREYGGRVVQTGGDSLLVAFDSIDGAVRCAVKVQQQVPVYDGDQAPDCRIRFRVGINIGDVIQDGTDLHGDGVNIAARLQTQCPPGGICVSRSIRDHVHGRLGLEFEAIGELTLKNIARPLEAFVLRLDPEATDEPPARVTTDEGRPRDSGRRVRFGTVLLAGLAALVACGAGGAVWWMFHGATAPASGGGFATQTRPRLSLVVLPFDNLSGNSTDDYLASGVTDDLTADLSHIPGAFVISRTTAYRYRGKPEDVRQIGNELAVRYVVHGSVQRLGKMLRVTAELASTETGAQLWTDNFEQPIDNLATGQQQIVVRMRSALNISLADIEAARSLRERSTNPDAFDLILRAHAFDLLPGSKDTASQALSLYERALEHDPNAVLALVGASFAVLNLNLYDGKTIPHDVALDRATHYLARAQALDPNSEGVLAAQARVLEEVVGPDYPRARSEAQAVARKLIDLYPNDYSGYLRLGYLARTEGRYDEAEKYYAKTIRISPRFPFIKDLYWNMAYCLIAAGHDREGLEWADRTMTAPGSLQFIREDTLLAYRAVAYFRTGNLETAKRLVAELNDRSPFESWRIRAPDDPDSAVNREQFRSIQEALKAAGSRDHLDPNANFGVAPDEVLHGVFGKTPTTAPGVTTLSTQQLARMLETEKPLVIDTMGATWYRSVPGAIGLDFYGFAHGTFTDAVQKRLEQKLRALTEGDMAKPIVTMGFNVVSFTGYNLALRIRHAGYTNVYWYRGGREAWEVAGKPEDVVRPADW